MGVRKDETGVADVETFVAAGLVASESFSGGTGHESS